MSHANANSLVARRPAHIWLFGAIILVLTLGTTAAHAHKVNIFAYVEDGKIFIESYFPDGKPVESGAVEVLDSQKTKVAQGTTDKEGKLALPIPKRDDLTIVINASMGHKTSFELKRSELGE